MALFRQRPKLTCRSFDDFPALVASSSKLDDIRSQQVDAVAAFRPFASAPNHLRQRAAVDAGALAVLGSATETAPDIRALDERCRVLARAVELQEAEVEAQRNIARQGIGADLRPQHQALMRDFIDKQQAANDAYDAILALRASATAICGCEVLPGFIVPEMQRRVYITSVQTLASNATGYLQQ